MDIIKYIGTVSPYKDDLTGSGLTWTTNQQATVSDDVGHAARGYPGLFQLVDDLPEPGVKSDGSLIGPSGSPVSGGKTGPDQFRLAPFPRVAHPSPPTVTEGAAHGISGGYLVPFDPASSVRMTGHGGGAWTTINTNFRTAGYRKPGNSIRDTCSLSFWFDGLVCAVWHVSAPGHVYRLRVDDMVVGDWFTQNGAQNGQQRYTIITFATRAKRRIRIDMFNTDIGGVVIGPNDSIGGTDTRGPSALVFGDSYQGGAAVYNGLTSMTMSMADALGWDDVANASVGGSGWLMNNGGFFGGQNSIDVLAPLIAASVPKDVYILISGKNDIPTYTAAQIGAAAGRAVTALRQAQPSSKIIVFGPMFPNAPVDGSASSTWQPVQDAIFTAVAGMADTVSTANAAIFTGNGTDAPTGTGNGYYYIQAADSTHPNRDGSDYAGLNRLSPMLRNRFGH
jgi:hypothetical protein